MNNLYGTDYLKSEVIKNIMHCLFDNQFNDFNKRLNTFIKTLYPYDAFHINGTNFCSKINFTIDERPTKTMWIDESMDCYKKAVSFYRTKKNLQHDHGIIEHFLGLLLNKAPSIEQFFEIVPENHLNSALGDSNIKDCVFSVILGRQKSRPTKPHQYEIFLSDHENEILLIKKYFIDRILLE